MTAKIVSFGSEPCFQGWHLGNTMVTLEIHLQKKKQLYQCLTSFFFAGHLMFTLLCAATKRRGSIEP